ncbi:hypothetical protein L3Q72_05840 [Vibrio sp. JC009]|uniref:hypothetical protein n=1 Tax=Vibrio sp. JC009 TaxID=2912314 RepID=UPI0023AE7E40|nr:hypothetical protein [Vibrio sp. JC009]WED22915.1 hypothetical protein L3Q72_05840 [Vibrio sp. JC009]
MLDSLLQLIPKMLLGAQLVLTLILVKGEICPGQRGRLHKLLPAIGTLWLACASLGVEALVVSAPIFYFYSQIQTKKTKKKGPLWLLYLADVFALLYVAKQVSGYSSLAASLAAVCAVMLLGAAYAHLSLKFAASRLDAFHKILPVSGILAGILLAVLVSVQATGIEEAQLEALSMYVFAGLASLVAGIVLWCWHMLTGQETRKSQLVMVLVLILGSCVSFQPLLFSA